MLSLDELERAIEDSFSKALSEIEDVCAFALYTDESFISLSVSVNTVSHLKERQEEDPEFAEEYKWTPAEWKIEDFNGEAFVGINDRLRNSRLKDGKNSKSLSEHREDVLKACLPILQNLRSKISPRQQKDFVLLFSISDFSDADFEIDIVKSLNPPALADEFIKWRETF